MKLPFPRNPLIPFDPEAALAEAAQRNNAGLATFVEKAILATSREDVDRIHAIVRRFVALCERHGLELVKDRGAWVASSLQLGMDIAIVHARTPLDLAALLTGDDDQLTHDLVGITRNVDRTNGELREGFKPRALLTPH